MKRVYTTLAFAVLVTACAQPEPIYDASVYTPGKAGLTSSPIPQARPAISATRIYDTRCHRPGQPIARYVWCDDEPTAEPPVVHPEPPEKPQKPKKPKRPKKECEK